MKTKICFKCERELPLSQFYRHPKMADGRLGKCKECTRVDVSENRAERREQYSKYERRRQLDPERRAKKAEYQLRHRRENPDRLRARNMVNYHVRKGNITRKPCELCGSKKSQAHHEDYSKPLDVRWLCFKHHREEGHGQTVISKKK